MHNFYISCDNIFFCDSLRLVCSCFWRSSNSPLNHSEIYCFIVKHFFSSDFVINFPLVAYFVLTSSEPGIFYQHLVSVLTKSLSAINGNKMGIQISDISWLSLFSKQNIVDAPGGHCRVNLLWSVFQKSNNVSASCLRLVFYPDLRVTCSASAQILLRNLK